KSPRGIMQRPLLMRSKPMKWQVKAALQFTLSRLPFRHYIYRRLQEVTSSNVLDINDQYGMKCKLLKRVQGQGLPIERKEFLEVGTGWYPVLPLMLYLLGPRRTVTVDVNPWLTLRALSETLMGISCIL